MLLSSMQIIVAIAILTANAVISAILAGYFGWLAWLFWRDARAGANGIRTWLWKLFAPLAALSATDGAVAVLLAYLVYHHSLPLPLVVTVASRLAAEVLAAIAIGSLLNEMHRDADATQS